MDGFKHSIKVPTQYKRLAAVLKSALERKKSLRNLIFEEKHAHIRGMQAVLKQFIDHRDAIENAIEETELLKDNPRLCPALCKILVTELIYGRKELKGESKPVATVRSYKDRLLAALEDPTSTTESAKQGTQFRYVRVNTNLLTMSEAFEMLAEEQWRKKETASFDTYDEFLVALTSLADDEYMVDMHLETLLIFTAKNKYYWASHSYIKEKKFMLQDKSTALVAELLYPPTGAVVLDMCAAPGMKTIQISNIMQNKGVIFAVEQNADRYKVLVHMTKQAGCKTVTPIQADALAIGNDDCPSVEYILVDPSCSGSGMSNRMSLEQEEKDSDRLFKLAGLQIKLLSHAMSTFPEVKRIVYSTCSLYEEENEQVVQRCLQKHPEFKLLSAKKQLRKKWKSFGSNAYESIGKNCLYARPDEDFTDGIFIAIFEKRRTEQTE